MGLDLGHFRPIWGVLGLDLGLFSDVLGHDLGLFWGLCAWIWVILRVWGLDLGHFRPISGVRGLDLSYFGGYGPGFGPIIKPTGLIGF